MKITGQRRRAASAGLALIAVLAAGAAGPRAEDLWVLTDSQQIFLIDARTLSVGADPVDLSGLTNQPPTCMAFSSVAGAARSAFVTQGGFVRVVDVATGALLAKDVDVAQLLNIQAIELTACSTAAPRTFQGQAAITRSHLFVGGNAPGGSAFWAVLDQAALISGSGTPLVGSGRLHLSAEVLDVEVLDARQGDGFQRAWFTLVQPVQGSDVILSIPLSLPADTALPAVQGQAQTLTLPTSGLPRLGTGIGVTREGQLPIRPGFVTGQLTALETGASCAIPGNPAQLTVHGPGPNSYSVFALDPLNADLLAINPNDCSSRTLDVGAEPVAIVPRRAHAWDGLFVLNHGGQSVTFMHPDGQLTTLPLPSGAGPVAGGMALGPACVADNLLLDKNGNDIELTWSAVACAPDTEFSAWCNCVDDEADCPCACDCSAPIVDPGCVCPLVGARSGNRGIGGYLVDYNPGDVPTTNPWKKLENTFSTTICHEGLLSGASWFYLINQSDEPPAP